MVKDGNILFIVLEESSSPILCHLCMCVCLNLSLYISIFVLMHMTSLLFTLFPQIQLDVKEQIDEQLLEENDIEDNWPAQTDDPSILHLKYLLNSVFWFSFFKHETSSEFFFFSVQYTQLEPV